MSQGDRKSTSAAAITEDTRNTAPQTRARFEYQDECIAHLFLRHLSDALQGIYIEYATDATILSTGRAPELVSIKHREPHHSADSGWTWSALGKDCVLTDLHAAWSAAGRSVSVAFLSNAGLSGPAKVLWDAGRGAGEESRHILVRRLAKILKVDAAEADAFLSVLSIPREPLPRRNEITDVGVREMERHLVAQGRDPRAAEDCYLALVSRIGQAGTDVPAARSGRSLPVPPTVLASVQAEAEARRTARYLSAEEARALITERSGPSGVPDAAVRALRAGTVLTTTLSRLDPVGDLGVHRATRRPEWEALPEYVSRQADTDLDAALASGGFVLVEGNSAVGKSRSAYECLRRATAAGVAASVVVPDNGEALRELCLEGHDFTGSVVWLDDLERFTGSGGFDSGLLRALLAGGTVAVLATIRSRAREGLLSADGAGTSLVKRLLSSAHVIRMGRRLEGDERTRAVALRADPRIASALDRAGEAGFAEYLAAGPAAVDRWTSGRHGAQEVGAALVSAAIDFRRAGYLAPVPKEWLEAVYRHYLDPRTRRRTGRKDLEGGFAWAVEPVEGASSCLESFRRGTRYQVFDYLVDHVQTPPDAREGGADGFSRLHGVREIPEVIWHELMDRVRFDDPQFMSCVTLSSVSDHPGLSRMYRHFRKHDRLPEGYFEDRVLLLNFMRAGLSIRFCIVCLCAVLDVAVDLLMSTALEELDPLLKGRVTIPGASQTTCLDMFESVTDEGELEDRESPVRGFLDSVPIEVMEQLTAALAAEGRLEAAERWAAYAGARRREREDEQLSLPGF
ncbi:hypothetical protein [Streptomyces sp. NPDC088748]|uniref:hypothetical protein n=1 Tax=Streptomyces sp. NPDC088748 TaxID=3365887 RepID=UPI00380EC0E3